MADNNFDTSGLMKMFTDAIQKSFSAKYRSGAQSAMGVAGQIGGVFGHQRQANEAADSNALASRRIGVEENQGLQKIDLEKNKFAFDTSPLQQNQKLTLASLLSGQKPGGVGAKPTDATAPTNGIGDYHSMLNKYLLNPITTSADKSSITNLLPGQGG
jgi:hypothetical protein